MDPQIAQLFRGVDRDNSGQISQSELTQALASGGLRFSADTCGLMIRMFDFDGSGSIGMNEFAQLHQFIVSMQNSFYHFDSDRSGSLSKPEVFQALQQGGFQLTGNTFESLYKSVDKNNSGSLSFDEYMELSLFLGILRNLFNWQDSDRDGQISLTYDMFVYLASFTK